MADDDFISILTAETETIACLGQSDVIPVTVGEDVHVVNIVDEVVLARVEEPQPVLIPQIEETILVSLENLSDNTLVNLSDDSHIVALEEETFEVQLAEVFMGTLGGGASLPKITTAVAVGNTEVCDSIPVSLLEGVKWFVVLIEDGLAARRAFEVNATWRGTTASHTVYAKNGDSIPHDVNVTISGLSNIELEITNNHSLDLVVKVTRLTI